MQKCNVTFHKHSCFQLEDEQCIFLFDWYDEALPVLDKSKMIYIFNSHKHGDHYNASLLKLAEVYENIQFIWSKEIKMPKDDRRFLAVKRNSSYEMDGPEPFRVETLESTDIGVAFLIYYRGIVIYHAGDLNWWSWSGEPDSWNNNMEARFKKIMQRLDDIHIDLAFVPLDSRQEERFCWGMDYFLEHTHTDCVFPMHMWEQLDVVKQWKNLPQSELYRDVVMEPEYHGQQFDITI